MQDVHAVDHADTEDQWQNHQIGEVELDAGPPHEPEGEHRSRQRRQQDQHRGFKIAERQHQV